MIESMVPRPRIGSVVAIVPTPLDLIAMSSLSLCIRDRPMMTPTSAAIGHVNAITFGISAMASCQRKLVGRFGLKKISEYLPPCCTNKMTESTTHDRRKYGTTARMRYHEMILPCFIFAVPRPASFALPCPSPWQRSYPQPNPPLSGPHGCDEHWAENLQVEVFAHCGKPLDEPAKMRRPGEIANMNRTQAETRIPTSRIRSR